MGMTFDGPNKLVVLTAGTTSVTVREIWSRWVDWYLTGENSRFLPAMRFVGGDPMTADRSLGITFFMMNGWRVRPYEGDHWLTIEGNLFTDPAGFAPFVPTIDSFNVTISMIMSNVTEILVTGGGGGQGLEDDILVQTGLILADTTTLKTNHIDIMNEQTAQGLAIGAVASDVADVLGDTDILKTDVDSVLANQADDATAGAVADLHSDVGSIAAEQAAQALTLADIISDIAAIPDHTLAINLIRKLMTNKTVEDANGVTVYDDDSAAVLGRWTWNEAAKTREKLT